MKYYQFMGKKIINKNITDIKSRNIGKKIVVLISFIILTVVIISGYNILIGGVNDNNNITTGEKKVEILNTSVTTEWTSGCKCDDTFEEHIKPGFYHTVYIGDGAYYNLKGEILNVAGEEQEKITINAKFYDKNGTEIFDANQLNSSVIIFNLSDGETYKFSMIIRPEEYFYLHKGENVQEIYDIFYTVETFEFDVSFDQKET